MSKRSTRTNGTGTTATTMSDSSGGQHQQPVGSEGNGAAAAPSGQPPPADAATAAASSPRRSTRASAARATDRIHVDNKSNKSAVSAISEKKQMAMEGTNGSVGVAAASDAAGAAISARPTRSIQHAASVAEAAAAATAAASPHKAKATASASSSRSKNQKAAGQKRGRAAAAAAASDEEEDDSDAAADGAGGQTAASRSRKKLKASASSAPATKRSRAASSKSARKPRAASGGAAASSSRPRKRARGRSANSDDEAEQSGDEEEEEEEEEQWEKWEEDEKEEEEEEEEAWLPSDSRQDGAVEARARRKISQTSSIRSSPLRLADIVDMNASDPNALKRRLATVITAMTGEDEQIAASLIERNSKTGSTFLMAAFHSLDQANTKGVSVARNKLMKVLNSHMDAINIDAVNHAGRALVHIACDPATYVQTSRRESRRYRWNQMLGRYERDEPEYFERTHTFNVQRGFALKLLQKLAQAGVDFNKPDKSGLIPVLGLARLSADSPLLIDFIMQMALTKRRAQIPFKLDHIEERTGNSVLHLMWAEGNPRGQWGKPPTVLQDAQRLADEDQLLQQLDLLATNRQQGTPLMRLAALVNKEMDRYSRYSAYHAVLAPDWIATLPTNMLQAWQEARAPRYKVLLERFLIPDLSDICCEFLLGRKVRAGRPLPAEEQRALFAAPTRVSEESKSNEGGVMAAAAAGHADGNADGGGEQVEGDVDVDGPDQQQILGEDDAGAATAQMVVGAQQNGAAGGDGPAPMEL